MRYRCAHACTAREEPLLGTASLVSRWLLVEQPGSWGHSAPLDSGLPLEIGRELHRRARAARARLVLLRRYGGRSPEGPRSCFVVDSAARRVERFPFTEPAGLLDLDLSPLEAGEPLGGAPVTDRLYLVCTNGSHDPCCAEFGRPIAAALDGYRPDGAWECSHIGGDRFAANVVVLPDGLYLGRVEPGGATGVVDAIEAGRVPLDHLRGRSTATFVAQAAEVLARRKLGADGLEDLHPVGAEELDDGAVRVVLAGEAGRYTATVAVDRAEPALLTCHSEDEARAPTYRLVSLDPA